MRPPARRHCNLQCARAGGRETRPYVYQPMIPSSSNRLALVFASLTLLMGGLTLYFGVQLGKTRSALELARQQVLARDRVIFRQSAAHERAAATTTTPAPGADTVKVEPPAAAVFADELGSLTGEQLSELMKAGLPADPEAFLRADLQKNAATLLGGTVTDVRILSTHAALVAFDAPDTDATAFMQYRVTGPGKVEWRQVAADIDDVDGWR